MKLFGLFILIAAPLLIKAETFQKILINADKEIEKFESGAYPNPTEEIVKINYNDISDLVDAVNQYINEETKNGGTEALIKILTESIEYSEKTMKIIKNIEPRTKWGKIFMKFMEQIVGTGTENILEESLKRAQGKPSENISKEDFMKKIRDIQNEALKELEDFQGDSSRSVDETEDVIEVASQLIDALEKLEPKNKVSFYLKEGAIEVARLIRAYMSYEKKAFEEQSK